MLCVFGSTCQVGKQECNKFGSLSRCAESRSGLIISWFENENKGQCFGGCKGSDQLELKYIRLDLVPNSNTRIVFIIASSNRTVYLKSSLNCFTIENNRLPSAYSLA